MQGKEEGFEESDQERLASKLNEKNQNQLASTFFVMPQAKPLLSKNIIDESKAKVLIKQIDIYFQPVELLSSNVHRQLLSTDKPHNTKALNLKTMQRTTIWDKYIVSQQYSILYLKFYRQDIGQLQKKGFKKLKLQLHKLCRSEFQLFSTYIVDLNFMSDAGSYLIRNLKPTSFQQIMAVNYQGDFKFDSQFQGGNLFAVFQKKNIGAVNNSNFHQFDLILQSDINSKGFSNWFYFSLRCKKKSTIKFNIVNMQKNYSPFSDGMKVTIFSVRKSKEQKMEWHRDGYCYSYYRNELRKSSENQTTYNTLTFCYDIKHDDDLIYFATNLPYSYTKMLKYLDSIEKVAKLNTNIYFKKQIIGNSISSNSCPIITLTWKREKKKDQKRKKKKIIGVIARQHPCETVSSYVMEGFINSLIYLNSQSSVQLLQNYIFKIVPMVNIDGVIYGNSRCDVSGNDINRKWTKNPNKFIYPLIAGVKNIFGRLLQEDYEIEYFLDLHGHSRKLGSFIYGCKTYDQFQSRQLAWIMSRLNSKILFQQCQFGLSQFKKQTARGIMSDLVIGKKSMTLETSFYGYRTIGIKHWEIRELQKIGATLIEGMYAQTTKDPKMFNWQTLKNQIKQAIQSSSSRKLSVHHQGSESSFGSDSNPSEDEMTDKEKAQHFLDPTTSLKIGLNEVRIIKKSKEMEKAKKEKDKDKAIQRKQTVQKYQMIVDGFKEKLDFQSADKSQNFQAHNEDAQRNLKQKGQKQKKFNVRHSRSVTKVLPFKFAQKTERLSLDKKNRKSVQILISRPQKLSVPDLPRVETKSNFWSNLKREYEVLLIERKLKDI